MEQIRQELDNCIQHLQELQKYAKHNNEQELVNKYYNWQKKLEDLLYEMKY